MADSPVDMFVDSLLDKVVGIVVGIVVGTVVDTAVGTVAGSGIVVGHIPVDIHTGCRMSPTGNAAPHVEAGDVPNLGPSRRWRRRDYSYSRW